MKKLKLSIIIAIYNEAKTAGLLLDKVYKHKVEGVEKEMILVEDNSTDGTRGIVESFVKNKKGIKLVLQDEPHGKGTAIRRGFDEARGDIILIQDADMEYDINDYGKLIAPIVNGKTSFVLGSRHLKKDGGMSWSIRKFSGKEKYYAHVMNLGAIFFHTFFNLLYGTHISDPTTMYKVFRRSLLNKVRLHGEYFELDWEIVCKFVRLGYVPLEVPIKYESRGYAEGKKVKFSRDVVRWLMMIVFTRFASIRSL